MILLKHFVLFLLQPSTVAKGRKKMKFFCFGLAFGGVVTNAIGVKDKATACLLFLYADTELADDPKDKIILPDSGNVTKDFNKIEVSEQPGNSIKSTIL